ncbi:MAG: cell envelope integrity protein CreD [Candidatus Parcubacteria bacterium]|nr:cell envelope integrity protein CreD [Burkholderiales bacterium]
MQRALLWKIALIVLVALLLQIPVEMIRGLVGERKQARDGVIAEIARRSSEAQRIVGPVLYAPWTRRSTEAVTTTDDRGRSRTANREKVERGHVALLPASLTVDGKIELQQKRRGIYTAHLYTLNATFRGNFSLPPGLGVPEAPGTLEWGRALLVLGIQDTRGIRDRVRVDWDGTQTALYPGGVEAAGTPNGIHADLGALPVNRTAVTKEFKIALSLLGTERLDIVPVGATTAVSLASVWPHPSFTGRILPDAGMKVSSEGFAASWRTSHFATNLAHLHQRCVQLRQCDAFNQHSLGVSFIQPVDLYQTVERSVKYGFLFIGLTFAAFFLFEILKRLAIHPIQYTLVGFALAVFFLLLISLSEHLGFAVAYALASAACVVLLGYYVGHVLHSFRRGAGFAVLLFALYGLLYVLLRAEDHALLAGSILVFTALSAAMVATRRVDWYTLAANPSATETPASRKPA